MANRTIEVAMLGSGCLVALVLAPAVLADEVTLRMHNDYAQGVGVWVRSEQNVSSNPWAYVAIGPRQNAEVMLRSQDRFILVVDVDQQRSRSQPVALKGFLTKHPDYVMRLSVEKLFGKVIDGPDPVGVEADVGPPASGSEPPAGEQDVLHLDFDPEPVEN